MRHKIIELFAVIVLASIVITDSDSPPKGMPSWFYNGIREGAYYLGCNGISHAFVVAGEANVQRFAKDNGQKILFYYSDEEGVITESRIRDVKRDHTTVFSIIGLYPEDERIVLNVKYSTEKNDVYVFEKHTLASCTKGVGRLSYTPVVIIGNKTGCIYNTEWQFNKTNYARVDLMKYNIVDTNPDWPAYVNLGFCETRSIMKRQLKNVRCDVEIQHINDENYLFIETGTEGMISVKTDSLFKRYDCQERCRINVHKDSDVVVTCPDGSQVHLGESDDLRENCPFSKVKYVSTIAWVVCKMTDHTWFFWFLVVWFLFGYWISAVCVFVIGGMLRILTYLIKKLLRKFNFSFGECEFCCCKVYDKDEIKKHKDCSRGKCPWCSKQIGLNKLAVHANNCSKNLEEYNLERGAGSGGVQRMFENAIRIISFLKTAGFYWAVFIICLLIVVSPTYGKESQNLDNDDDDNGEGIETSRVISGLPRSSFYLVVGVSDNSSELLTDDRLINETALGVGSITEPSEFEELKNSVDYCYVNPNEEVCTTPLESQGSSFAGEKVLARKKRQSSQKKNAGRNNSNNSGSRSTRKKGGGRKGEVNEDSNGEEQSDEETSGSEMKEAAPWYVEEIIDTTKVLTKWGYVNVEKLYRPSAIDRSVEMTLNTEYETENEIILEGSSIGTMPLESGTGMYWKELLKNGTEVNSVIVSIVEFGQTYNLVLDNWSCERDVRTWGHAPCTGECPKECGGQMLGFKNIKTWENDRNWGCNPSWCWTVSGGCTCCGVRIIPKKSGWSMALFKSEFLDSEVVLCLEDNSAEKKKCRSVKYGGSLDMGKVKLSVTEEFGIKNKLPREIAFLWYNSIGVVDFNQPDSIILNPRVCEVECQHGEIGDVQSYSIGGDMTTGSLRGIDIYRTCAVGYGPKCMYNNIVEDISDKFAHLNETGTNIKEKFRVMRAAVLDSKSAQLIVKPDYGGGMINFKLEVNGFSIKKVPIKKLEIKFFSVERIEGCYACSQGFFIQGMILVSEVPETGALVKLVSKSENCYSTGMSVSINKLESKFSLKFFSLEKNTTCEICIEDYDKCTQITKELDEPKSILQRKHEEVTSVGSIGECKEWSWFACYKLTLPAFFSGIWNFFKSLFSGWKTILIVAVVIAIAILIVLLMRLSKRGKKKMRFEEMEKILQ